MLIVLDFYQSRTLRWCLDYCAVNIFCYYRECFTEKPGFAISFQLDLNSFAYLFTKYNSTRKIERKMRNIWQFCFHDLAVF